MSAYGRFFVFRPKKCEIRKAPQKGIVAPRTRFELLETFTRSYPVSSGSKVAQKYTTRTASGAAYPFPLAAPLRGLTRVVGRLAGRRWRPFPL